MNNNLKDPYSSSDYYKRVYNLRRLDLREATLWMANYFKVVKKIFPRIFDFKQAKILEIGSGYGGFVNVLNLKGFKNVVASDMTDYLFSKEIKSEFILLDLLNCQPDRKFDLIFAFDVMEHINETEKAIDRIKEILNPGGLFIFSTPYPVKKHLMDIYHTNMQYPNFYTNLFHRSGFELLRMADASLVPLIWRWRIPCFIKRILENRLFVSETFFIFKKI